MILVYNRKEIYNGFSMNEFNIHTLLNKMQGGCIMKDFPDFMKSKMNHIDSSQQNTKDM